MRRAALLTVIASICASALVAGEGCWMSAGYTWPDADSDSDGDSEVDSEGDTDTSCAENPIALYNDPARVMIVLDHSSSMGNSNNWDIARNAVYDLLAAFSSESIWFGLDTLPDPSTGDCSVADPVVVDCAPDTSSAISAALSSMGTLVSTPLYEELGAIADPSYAPQCTSGDGDRYVILIADGEDSCTYPTTDQLAERTAALVDEGVRVIVVGFDVNEASSQLDAIASNGGTEYSSYLNASDETTLNAALDDIADTIDDCSLTLTSPSALASPGFVNLYLDGDLIPLDDDCSSGYGWHWTDVEAGELEMCEDTCSLLEAGDFDALTATFGCQTEEA
jgi:hypothetical protein